MSQRFPWFAVSNTEGLTEKRPGENRAFYFYLIGNGM